MPTSVIISDSYKKETIDFFDKDKVYEIVENTSYSLLKIHMDDNDKLYFEGLDQINIDDDNIFDIDDSNNQYIRKNCIINFYDESEPENSYVPGYYKISLFHDDELYIRWIHVSPKFFSEDDYSDMVNDIERKIVGISQSGNRGSHGVKIINVDDYDNRKVDILVKNFFAFQSAIYRISKVPRNRISSEYKWSRKNNVAMDYISTIKMSKNPSGDKRYLKSHVIDYNTRDNISLKNTLIKIREMIVVIIHKLRNSLNSKDFHVLNNYLSLIDNLFENSWLSVVKENRNMERIVGSAFSNFSYNFIFDLNDKLDSVKNIKNKKHEGFSYFRKSSQSLYEIWGYFKVIDALISLGFEYQSSFNEQLYKTMNPGEVIKNGLKSGTSITLSKTNNGIPIKVKIIYDDEITNSRNSKHLWTDAVHKRPDIRMDFFDKDNTFIGAIVVDTKYRRRETFTKRERKGGSREQLSSYAQMIMSNDLYKSSSYDQTYEKHFKNNNCVVLLGVMYPGDLNGYEDGYNTIKRLVSGRRVMERPGKTGKNITRFLVDGINELMERYDTVVIK